MTQGLSDAYPDRVLTTPISEASLFGVAAGMALRGQRPILEIMFGDFVALGLDQIVNGISKFREMYDDQVTVPLVVRAPMGARRGYGPTHSQSLEKLLLGIPNICVVAASECHDVGALLTQAAVEDERPVFFIENKLLYGRTIRRPEDGHIGELAVRESGGPYPALTFSATDFTEGVGDDRHVRRHAPGRPRSGDGAAPRARDLLRGRRALSAAPDGARRRARVRRSYAVRSSPPRRER